jgi:uncharacterized radical SAM superfamily Fe-S cluster-containing enzyme
VIQPDTLTAPTSAQGPSVVELKAGLPCGECEPSAAHSHSGQLSRPIQCIRRTAVTADTACTDLEKYKLSLRKYAPVQRGREGLPWECQSHCLGCDQTVPSRFVYDESEDAIYLEFRCPTCGERRERHHDLLFVKNKTGHKKHQPRTTFRGAEIRPIQAELPRTVESLCPECCCMILGRYYVKDRIVYIEKTCPEHGYFRDKISTDVDLYLKAARTGWEDERGVYDPQVTEANACPSDCGVCNQHMSTSCLAQIDMTNRCNLTCPVCFASANQAGYVAEPTYDMVVEMMQALRDQRPHPPTALQFTGGEPTIHPQFIELVRKANEMGFTHVQAATNGIALANVEFAERAAEAGLHTLYLQFDGLDDRVYKRLRGRPLLEMKLACLENCHKFGMKICLVPTVVKGENDDQVGEIFRFAVDNIEVISAISYQPVAFTGRISRRDLDAKRYTLGDLAHDLAEASGADLYRDFFPLNLIAPMSRVMQLLDGKPKIRTSCHTDCAFGTYFFVTPGREAIPIPKLFDVHRLFGGFNELHKTITAKREMANRFDRMRIAAQFVRSYRWQNYDRRVGPFTFVRALQGLTNKAKGRGVEEHKGYRTLMAAGMHFMDRYNYDTERIRRCVIQYSTPDGLYPFCTINGGPTYRPYIEQMIAVDNERWQAENPDKALRPRAHPDAVMPWAGRYGRMADGLEEWGGRLRSEKLRRYLERGRIKDQPGTDDSGDGGRPSGCGGCRA